ncbi:MAG: glycosyltransferase involved in cell wall biosynthesis [Cyclobacteriaceae bacterium]|jgi:glycosyltransferase involved in cell wall biosynthesis
MVKRGHDVTLYATGDSKTEGKLASVCKMPLGEGASLDPKVWECLHISYLMERANDFDIIHNHFDFLPLTYSQLIDTPMITTIHGFSSEKILHVYKKYNEATAYVSISKSDQHKVLSYLSTIHHGIDPSGFIFEKNKENYLLCFGRIHPDKGTHLAIEISKNTGLPLKIAGLIQDQHYFETQVKPHIDNEVVTYEGNANPIVRNQLLGSAKALLHPISFDEPFGLSVAEAMMSGTPVIAFDRGSMPELILDRKTGFLVKDVAEATNAVGKLATIDTQFCRDHVVKHFSVDRMVDEYFTAYKQVISGEK